MSDIDSRRAVRIVLLAAIVAVLGAAKLAYLPGTGPFGTDGSFYVNVARNVQEGAGLKTNVSLYHYGQTELPTRSPLIYPVWPALLGAAGSVVGLFEAVNVLPPLFYVLDLILFYVLVSRLASPVRAAAGVAALQMVLLGVNVQFFGTTSYPYTEGLAFFFALLALLAFDRGHAAAAGLLCGLALLTRTQMVLVGIGIAVAVIWSAVRDRRNARQAIAFLGVYALMVACWQFFFVRVATSPTVPLPAFAMWNETSGVADWLRQRVEGVIVSLTPWSPFSYFAIFNAAFLLPLAAIPVALVRWWRTKTFAPRPLAIACSVTALGTFASLNLYHHVSGFLVPWLFGYRHALPMIFGIAVAAVYLPRVVTYVCLSIAIVFGVLGIVDLVTTPRVFTPAPAEARMIAWLEGQQPRPVVLTARAQHLSAYSHASIHWTECRTGRDMTRLMLQRLPIQYVIVYPGEERCEFLRGLRDVLDVRTSFGEGRERIVILSVRGATPPAPVPASTRSARTPPG